MVTLGAEKEKSEDDVGGNRPEPGRYHSVITGADESFEKVDKIVVDFRVLAGNKDGQVDRTITEYYAVSDKAMPRLKRLALCIGLLMPGEPEKEVDFEQAVGRQLVIEVEENEYEKDGEKKKSRRVSWMGMWSLGNKEVADIPKDAEALKVIAGIQPGVPAVTAAPPAATPTAASPPQNPPPPVAEAATEPLAGGGATDWDDL